MASNDILVVLFLRGGMDGLSLVAPTTDEIYQSERHPKLRVDRDGENPGLPLNNEIADENFCLHPKAQALRELYEQGHLAIVHACGLTTATHSHSEAADYIERGTPDDKNTSTGWLTRFVEQQKFNGLMPTVAIGNSAPISLLGCNQAIVVPSPKHLQMASDGHYKDLRKFILRDAYLGNSAVIANGVRALNALDIFATHLPKDNHGKWLGYTPAANASYPTEGYASELSDSLKSLAQLIKMDVGVRVATVDYGGWDTHIGQGNRFPNLVDGLSRCLSAFWTDMAAYQERLTIVVMSEFGRRLRSNESNGTDHGHGNVMLVLGGHVIGGSMYGSWPGLMPGVLDNQVDLAITTDYRSVLSEILKTRFGVSNLSPIFPKFEIIKPLALVV